MKSPPRFFILAQPGSRHGVTDAIAGWMLGVEMPGDAVRARLPWLAIDAALAFAGQLPVARIMDRSLRRHPWLMGALVTMSAAVAAWKISPGAAVSGLVIPLRLDIPITLLAGTVAAVTLLRWNRRFPQPQPAD